MRLVSVPFDPLRVQGSEAATGEVATGRAHAGDDAGLFQVDSEVIAQALRAACAERSPGAKGV